MLVMCQLRLLQCFVENLLDLRQLMDKVFSLEKYVFDPNETFKLILDIYSPQASA